MYVAPYLHLNEKNQKIINCINCSAYCNIQVQYNIKSTLIYRTKQAVIIEYLHHILFYTSIIHTNILYNSVITYNLLN